MVTAKPVRLEQTDAEMLSDTNAQYYENFPSWALPPIFLLMLAYVEVAGRYYKERRKWYIIAMALSNVSFPWLVEHDRMSPMLTGWYVQTPALHHCSLHIANKVVDSVFAFALRPTWAYAMMDYHELRPSPGQVPYL